MKLSGIFPAIATPFDHKGDLYKVKFQHNIEKWNRAGLAGYLVTGSTGETPYLNAEEKLQVWRWAAEYAAPGRALIAGAGAESVRETVTLINSAAGMGYHAALVLAPHYFRAMMSRMETQVLFFRTVADQAKIPVLLYHFPQVTGIDLTPEAVATLAEHPNIIGMKDSSGNFEGTKKFIAAVKPGFQVLTGSAQALAISLAAGCPGAVLALANAVPYACISIYEAHRSRETEAAMDWQNRIACAAKLVATTYGIPGLKHAMDLNGYYGGPPRLPLTVVTPEAQREIAQAFDGLKG
jgi:4-hydroxy-2-oxoglutarate aldolase